ncbi:rRNA-binding ribosome biosynthesis protein utp25 [Tilletia horrida]|uniref:U3 small nucleolar RNA-associated protein 25 n=1 Tax=Tilletia horrida TaxID=155126 RepID=A0AAN6GWC1_9BASI|nr:rRNA-binding ribosome biosynthesis protein utp25 [Tilletia horrida]
MTVDTSTDLPTKLLTLINVSAARPDTPEAKRARLSIPFTKIRQADARAKLAQKNALISELSTNMTAPSAATPDKATAESTPSTKSGPDPFHTHFDSIGAHGKIASSLAAASEAASSSKQGSAAATALSYTLSRHIHSGLGESIDYTTSDSLAPTQDHLQETVRTAYAAHLRHPPTPLQRSTLAVLQSYADLLHPHVTLTQREQLRSTVSAHLLSHVQKTRRTILKNNERLAKAAAATGSASTKPNGKGKQNDDAMQVDEEDDNEKGDLDDIVRDQGFTRPKILLLLPLRNSALAWVQALSSVSGCVDGILPRTITAATSEELTPSAQRFLRDFTLPEQAVDRLAGADAAMRFPADHIATFRGNIDDSFVLGFKVTRKEWRAYARYYDADIIVASPLGLRLAIEKDDDSDFLSSIEIVVADQLDVMQMQNWEHVKFVFSRLNHIPRKVHESTDFARVRQWYLDGASTFLRQTILLSSLDTPEIRALFTPLRNLAGRRRVLSEDLVLGGGQKRGAKREGTMALVKEGVRQVFVKFDCANAQAEGEIRLTHFTTKTLPMLLKSAIASSKTLIFVPSYFDFVLLVDHLQKREEKGELKFASISEYSNNREIARAREAFFTGKKDFLVVTERFHFYRRYVLRGARTLVFYAPPYHPTYYAEMAQMPFASSASAGESRQQAGAGEAAMDASDVSIQTIFCQYDYLRLEGLLGKKKAAKMCGVATSVGTGVGEDEDEEDGEGSRSRRFGEARSVGRSGGEDEREGALKKTWRFV